MDREHKIKEIFKKYNLKIIGKEPHGLKIKTTAINNEGYLIYITYDYLKSNKGTYRLWHKSNPYSIYNINLFLKLNNINTYTISDEYFSLTDKMKWHCGECGCIFEDNFQHIKNNKKYLCNKCSKIKEIDNRRNDINSVKEVFIRNGFIPLFNKVERNDKKVTALNEEGYLVYTTYNNIKIGYSSYIVHHSNPYSIYNIQKYIKDNDLDCKLVSEEYYSNNVKLKFKCKCGNIFETRWGYFFEW